MRGVEDVAKKTWGVEDVAKKRGASRTSPPTVGDAVLIAVC